MKEETNKEVTKKENKVKEFIKKNWPHLVLGAGVVVGGTALGVKYHKWNTKHKAEGQAIVDALSSRDVVNYGRDCLTELMTSNADTCDIFGSKAIDEDIYTKMAAAIEEAVLNSDEQLPTVIKLKRTYNVGSDWWKDITIEVKDRFT